MDNKRMQHMTAEKTQKRFGSHTALYSKYIPKTPASAEREYIRLSNAYLRILKEELEKELPALKEAYKPNRDKDVKERRNDGMTYLMLSLNDIFNRVRNNVIARTNAFDLFKKLTLMSLMNRKLTVREWKRAIKSTLGIDIREDYYLGDFYAEALKEWVDYNVSLIKTIPEETLDKMHEIVLDDFAEGKTTTRIIKDIQKAYSVSKRRATLIARDQTAKLSGQIQKQQQTDAGITEYIWYTVGDNRVRHRHRQLNGKKFSWNDPPDVGNGRKCHPGEDFQCRCIARPVFNKETISLPLDDMDIKIN